MKRLVVCVALVIMLSGAIVGAQDSEDCDLDALKTGFASALEAATTLDDMNAVHTEWGTVLTRCRLVDDDDAMPDFTGQGDGIVGPIELEPGYYEFAYTASKDNEWANFNFNFQHDSDHFGNMQLGSYPVVGRELTQFSGGTYFINVESDDTWEFSFLPFDADSLTDAMILESTAVEDYVGPFELEGGFYLLEYEGEVDPNYAWSGWHFYAQVRTASDLDREGSATEAGDADFSGEEILNLEAGVYIITVQQDGLKDWTVKLSPVG